MSGKKTAVFGIYHDRTQAELSVDRLLAAGFSNNDISVLLPDNQGSKDFAHEKNIKAPEGTTAGVATGETLGWWLALALLRFQELVHLLRPVRSWPLLRGSESAVLSAVWRIRWNGHPRVRGEAI